jgi:[NiFe] hydrogenase assembly HybE family chaperone
MTQPLTPKDQDRIRALVDEFRRIGEERMKDLGLYNPAIKVEAVGFRPWQGWLAGVLVTPWFINFMALPASPEADLSKDEVGGRRRLTLPKGEVVFVVGEVDEGGRYLSHSIHSPLGHFPDHAAASTAAWAAVGPFFAEPGQEVGEQCGFGWGVNHGP